ncbi:MAG: phage N-6-adenine-methyltransferase [bacterium]|nr:phage N-6-adenine-methyltransferase [bacterium]
MSKLDNLQTPKYIIDALGHFDLDPCSGEHTNIADVNWWDGRGENGLERNWFGFVWCNPPFSQKALWIDKMIKHGHGILILPERGSAPWFGPLAEAAGRYFVMGKKINFIGGPSSNNLGSVLFPFGYEATNRLKNSELPGHLNSVQWFNPRVA